MLALANQALVDGLVCHTKLDNSYPIGYLLALAISSHVQQYIDLLILNLRTDAFRRRMKSFDEYIARHNNEVHNTDLTERISHILDWNRFSIDESDPNFQAEFQDVISDEFIPEADIKTEIGDPYNNMEIGLPWSGAEEAYISHVSNDAPLIITIPQLAVPARSL